MNEVILFERPHLVPSPVWRQGDGGRSHGQMEDLTSSRVWDEVGRGQNEREFRDEVGRGQIQLRKIGGTRSGRGHFLRSNNEFFSGRSGTRSNERNYA